ncbi:unnamed protein product [Echinostoma caproni]|uniref:Uncharacterized protein n=1 Tax=Echinostoma caproni TaxID=27848 RepID=A0A183B967_9TREM|nr:unnamed protein product [Echinostoma caproni]
MIDQVCASLENTFRPDPALSSGLFNPSESGETANAHELSQIIDPVVNDTSLRPADTSSVTSDTHQACSNECTSLPTGDLDVERNVDVPRKIPARTRAKLAWIQMQPHRSLPARFSCAARHSDDDDDETIQVRFPIRKQSFL